MAKMKVFELKNLINEQAKLKLESKDILDVLESRLGVKKTHSSNLEDNEVKAVKDYYLSSQAPADKKAAPARASSDAAAQTAADQAATSKTASAAGAVRVPGGVARPAGTSVSASEAVRVPGAVARPVGGAVRVPGGVARPAGEAVRVPGSVARPASPAGEVTRVPGAVARPAGEAVRVPGAAARPIGPAGEAARRPGAEANPIPAKPAGQVTQAQKQQTAQQQAGQKSHKRGRGGSSSHNGVWQRPISERHLGLPEKPAASDSTVPSGTTPSKTGETGQVTDKGMTAEVKRIEEKIAEKIAADASRMASEAAAKQEAASENKGPDGGKRSDISVKEPDKTAAGTGAAKQTHAKPTDEKPADEKPAAVKPADAGTAGTAAQKPQAHKQDGTAESRQSAETRQAAQSRQAAEARQGAQSRQAAESRQAAQSRQAAESRQAAQSRQTAEARQGVQSRQSTEARQGAQSRQSAEARQGAQSRQSAEARQAVQSRQGAQSRQSAEARQGAQSRQAAEARQVAQSRQAAEARRGDDSYRKPHHDQRQASQTAHPRTGADSQGRQKPQDRKQFAPRGFEIFKKDEDERPSFQKPKKGTAQRGGDRRSFDQQILDQKVAEKSDFSNKRNRERLNKDKLYKDKGILKDLQDEDEKIITKLLPKKGQFIKPKPVEPKPEEDEIKVITIPDTITIKQLAEKMKMPAAALVKKLFLAGKMVSINQEVTFEEAEEIALEYDIICEREIKVNELEELLKDVEDDPSTLIKRPPVVCVMGHVDHGKTSLLDAIRETNVTAREAGGITQHIGAYTVEINGEQITFLDTPGHEAFTSMRMRGAQATDIAILVVAADDGVMPQTIEAISHAKAAGVQIIVAVNKIDKPSANVERVKQELTEYGLIAEDWGGDTIFVPVSAHTKEGIEHLLEMIILASEMLELKANPDRKARGLIIEAELDKGRGPVATILVQKGTLRVGDNIAVGSAYGKVRAMMDDKGRKLKEALPSTPVEILGLNGVPDVGEIFIVTETEKEARTIAEAYISQSKEKLIADTKTKLSLDGLFSQIKAGNIKELNLIIKADVQGSVEAMKQSMLKLSNDEVAVKVIHGGVGAINESDVILASTSNAIIIGFNVKPDNIAKETAEREKIDIKLYKVIYNAINDIEAAMKGMLDPVYEEKIIGHAEIRQTFRASGVGMIAGSYVTDGKILRGCKTRIYRGNDLIYEGSLASLKRFQDDVKEVAAGYECGLVFNNFNNIAEGDKVELYIMAEVPR